MPSWTNLGRYRKYRRASQNMRRRTAKARQGRVIIEERRRPTPEMVMAEAELVNAESALGRTLFGPIPEGHRREFFHHKQNAWIWHESWVEDGHRRSVTTRYEVRPSGVFKRAGRTGYMKIEGEELKNFRRAAHAYLKIIKEKLYN